MVVVYHLWPSRFPGGFIGVDVFFVISGFLITTLLLREHDRSSRVDLWAFWRRRARRLLPALFVLIPVCVIAARLADPDLLVGIDRQTIGALTFTSNWLEIGADADYFNHSAPQLFSMLWSLAVEEQFYVVWPVAVLALLAVTTSARARCRLVLLVAAVSAVLMAARVDSSGNPTRVYYGTDTHMFGLMIGAALAIAFSADLGVFARPRWLRIRRWLGFVSIAGLVALGFTLHSDSAVTYRGGLVLASLLTAAVVAALPGPTTALARVCHITPLAWIGQRSYGIYLWHWPVILIVMSVAGRPVGFEPTVVLAAVAVGLTIGIAQASWVLVERPTQHRGAQVLTDTVRNPRARLALGAVLVTTIGITATAPGITSAQDSIQTGNRLIEEQTAALETGPAGASTPTSLPLAAPVVTSPPTSVPTATSAPTTAPPEAPSLADWTPGEVAPGDLVMGFGDSVMSGGAEGIYHEFPDIRLDAKPNRTWTDVPQLVEQAIASGAIRPVVVLDFGTNAGLTTDRQKRAANEALDLLGPGRRIVLVNLFSPGHFVDESNAALESIAAQRSNVVVADWHATVAGHAEYFHDDATHPNITGVYVYTALLQDTLTALGPG